MSQMNADTFAKHAPIAVAAIAEHATRHQLPFGRVSIDVDSYDQTIKVAFFGLDAGEQARWISSLVIESEVNEPGVVPGRVRTVWMVRTPDLGIGFELVTFRTVPLLSAVTA